MRDQLLIVSKEEELVFDDRATQHSAELIGLVWRPGRREKVTGIQSVVAEKVKNLSVEGVRSGFDGQIDDRSAERTIFSIGIAGFNFERVHRIEWRRNADERVKWFGVMNSVNHVVVPGPGQSVYDSLGRSEGASGGRVLGEVAPPSLNRSGNDGHQLLE